MIPFDDINKIDSTIEEVKEKIGFLRKVLESITDAEFSDYEAFLCWERIIQHRVDLSQKLNREVNLYVSIVDYFTYVDKTLKNPMTTSKQLLKLSTQR